jgi:hypothetical protein
MVVNLNHNIQNFPDYSGTAYLFRKEIRSEQINYSSHIFFWFSRFICGEILAEDCKVSVLPPQGAQTKTWRKFSNSLKHMNEIRCGSSPET